MTSAQQQLYDLNLSDILQFGWSEEELKDRLQDVFNDGYGDLLDELTSELTPEQVGSFGALLSKENLSLEEIQDVFSATLPNYSDRVKELVLQQKAALIKGYVELLKVFYVEDAMMVSILRDVDELMASEEWAAVGLALIELQKEE